MVFDYSSDDYLEISMDKYMEDVVKDANVARTVDTAATKEPFKRDKTSAWHPSAMRFHSTVANWIFSPLGYRSRLIRILRSWREFFVMSMALLGCG